MKLVEAWEKRNEWKNDYHIPSYDRTAVKNNTLKAPIWLHFGAGNIFRAFIAAAMDTLIEQGLSDKGIIVCEDFDKELIDKAYRPYDSLSLLVTLKADGSISRKVIGSIIDAVTENDRMRALFCEPSVQMVSFTITEKGYCGPLMRKIAEFCLERYKNGAFPVALVSMDNCARNGEVLSNAVLRHARNLVVEGYADEGFIKYLTDPLKVSFPWSAIDKITPRPDAHVKELLEKEGFEDTQQIVTKFNTYTAPYVNAEETEYLVIEDAFPNGRPKLEAAGIMFSNRETVEKFEKMKVGTCLNPLHTALAIFGCLLGYETVHEEMKDENMKKLVWELGYKEGMPVACNPGIASPGDFLHEVLTKRFTNPFLPDSPRRIALDTSQKIPVRFGQTLKAYESTPELDLDSLTFIPLVFAGWLRYLIGVNDRGESFELSPDPRLEELTGLLKDIKLGKALINEEGIDAILSDRSIFVIDMYSCGMAKKVKEMFKEMIKGPGAVRKVLQKYCG
ncbi:MAG: mannitol dehydrogenase family protein [Clostridiaceae bacterium]|nr:mannitol dehydrogenase family protein [Clostridiaceae bacterium]